MLHRMSGELGEKRANFSHCSMFLSIGFIFFHLFALYDCTLQWQIYVLPFVLGTFYLTIYDLLLF